MRTGRPPKPLIERFLAKFDIGNVEECWNWKGCCHPQGYGFIKRKDGAQLRAHRVSWEYHFGSIPQGIFVCHTCDNAKCVNPNHLFLGTNQDNQNDSVKKGRKPSTKGEKNGAHKLTEKEVYFIRDDKRKYPDIAKDYCVSSSLIGLIKRRERWNYLK